MRKLHKILALALAAVLVFGTAACGNVTVTVDGEKTEAPEAENADGADEVVTLHFYHSDDLSQDQVAAWNAAHPETQIELSQIPNDDYDDKIQVMLAGDADADVFWLRSPGQARNLYNQGALLGLNDLMEQYEIDPEMNDFRTAYTGEDGQMFGITTTKSCWLLWYNKDLFEATGKELPGEDLTWEQYADLCAELTTDEYMGAVFPTWVMGLGASAASNWLDAEDLSITKEYMQVLHRIYCEDHSNYDLEDMTGSFDVNGVFAEGNTYMMINGDWTFNLLPDSNPDFEWGALPLPHMSSIPAGSSVGSAGCYSISSKCEYPERAMEFIKFCNASDEGAVIYADNNSIACYRSDAALEKYSETVSIPGVEYVFSSSVVPEDSFCEGYEEIKDAFVSEMQLYLLDQEDIDTAFENFLAARAGILGE